MYKLLISSKAERQLKKIPKDHKRAILEALADIKEEPFLGKPLTRNLTGRLSYRVGVYRIVYRIKVKDNTIEVLTAGHRSVVYN